MIHGWMDPIEQQHESKKDLIIFDFFRIIYKLGQMHFELMVTETS